MLFHGTTDNSIDWLSWLIQSFGQFVGLEVGVMFLRGGPGGYHNLERVTFNLNKIIDDAIAWNKMYFLLASFYSRLQVPVGGLWHLPKNNVKLRT
jgi:hypothetical protein